MKRLFKACLLAALAVPFLTAAPSAASAAEPRLSTDKTVYEEGEDILVTAYGEGKDWVGIYARGETPGSPASIYWYYVASDAKPGEAVNIKKTRSNNRAEYASLPGGAYTVFLLLNDGYTVAESVDITILPDAARRLDVKDEPVYEGGGIPVTAFGRGGESAALFRADDPVSAGPLASFEVTAENCGSEVVLKPSDGDLPAGEYVLRLLPAGGGEPIASVGVTVLKAGTPEAPFSLTYEADRASEGFAGGRAVLTPSTEGAPAEHFYLWWGKNGEPLEGYTYLARRHASDGPVTITLPETLTIPEGAEEILASAVNRFGSSAYASVPLPEGARAFETGEPLLRFQVTSDWHITDNPGHEHNRHLGMMLDDIAEVCPSAAAIIAVGDIADHGNRSEYDRVKEIAGSREGVPPIHYVIGNHDVSQGYNKQIGIFNEFSGNDSAYYDLWIGGYHFIFLAFGSEGAPMPIPEKELKWLDEKLAEDASPSKPIFVFCHESIKNTVAGSTPEEGWWGISNGDKVASLFSNYPQVVFFNGHSHWELSSENEMFAGDETRTFSAFNTSAVGYLWTGYNVVPGEYLYGSEGLFVEVSEDALTVRGRDFVNGLWTASAQYAVHGAWEENKAASAPASEGNAEALAAEPADPATETSAASPEAPAEDTGSGEKGCASALEPAAAVSALCAGAAAMRGKKKYAPGERKDSPDE